MSEGFDSYTKVKQLPGVEEWELLEPLGYEVGDPLLRIELQAFFRRNRHLIHKEYFVYSKLNHKLTVLAGFVTDFGSVPRPVWAIVAPQDIRRPSIPHDAFYRTLWDLFKDDLIARKEFGRYRLLADRIFRESMDFTDPAIPGWKKTLCYLAVRWFGAFSWAAKNPPGTTHNRHSRKPK